MADDKKPRGRPRKDPERLAQWKPPEDWVRVVAWTSPEERKILKKVAVEEDTSVAQLIRSLASSLDSGTIDVDELLKQFRKSNLVMEKIPTLFKRDAHFNVTEEITEGCEWVMSGDGTATEKLDGTNIRLTTRKGTIVRVEKRRNPSKAQKQLGIIDGWYVDASADAKEDRWIFEAIANTNTSAWQDNEHPCEAIGPKIQGNPLGLAEHICVPFNIEIPVYKEVPRHFESIRDFVTNLESKYSPENAAEGIVFHHPDGRRAKIKAKDFVNA